MRILLILRGNYYAGQEEFIKENRLKDYTLDLNSLRLLSGSVSKIVSKYKNLNLKNDEELYKILLQFLEMRMQKGEFCIINAYNETLKVYKELAKQYRYDIYIIDFKSSLEECLRKNEQKAKERGYIVSQSLLKKTHHLLERIPKKYTILNPNDWKKCLYQMPNLSKYRKIHHIGDIQGCFSILKEYLQELEDDECYIFLGDYIDRGIKWQGLKILA